MAEREHRPPIERTFIQGPKVPLVAKNPELGKIMEMKPLPPPRPPAPPGKGEEDPDDGGERRGRIVAGIVSAERIAFLERVERLMELDRRVRELEEENQALSRVVARQQAEVDALRKGA